MIPFEEARGVETPDCWTGVELLESVLGMKTDVSFPYGAGTARVVPFQEAMGSPTSESCPGLCGTWSGSSGFSSRPEGIIVLFAVALSSTFSIGVASSGERR